jgi:hypothetical protein
MLENQTVERSESPSPNRLSFVPECGIFRRATAMNNRPISSCQFYEDMAIILHLNGGSYQQLLITG